MKRLGLYDNSFTGTLCTELGLMTSLVDLELQGNDISGTIPFSDMKGMQALRYMFLQDNHLTGDINFLIDPPNGTMAPASSWTMYNVLGNPLSLATEASPDQLLCKANVTFFEQDCKSLLSLERPLSCDCSCACET